MLSLALIVALCSCSKSDDVATDNTAAPPKNILQSAHNSTENDATDTAQIPASEPKQFAEKAATETEPKGYEKQGPNAAHDRAKGRRSLTARRWDEFQAAIKRCLAVTLSAREQCLAEARHTYRSANFDCAALPGREHKECLKYAKLWEDTEIDVPTAAVTHDEEPAAIPAPPDDAGPPERNRASTEQSQDAVGTASDEAKQN
jgi:hypothetical protein